MKKFSEFAAVFFESINAEHLGNSLNIYNLLEMNCHTKCWAWKAKSSGAEVASSLDPPFPALSLPPLYSSGRSQSAQAFANPRSTGPSEGGDVA